VGVRDEEGSPAHSATDHRHRERRGEARDGADGGAGDDVERVMDPHGDAFEGHRDREQQRGEPPRRRDAAQRHRGPHRERCVARRE
jgi:hypothetical protein